MTKIDREILIRTMHGYEEVNRITDLERRTRLKALTEEEARSSFNYLCQDMTRLIVTEDQITLTNHRLQHHLRVRKAMLILAQTKGYESTL
jgi:hypothetical protein